MIFIICFLLYMSEVEAWGAAGHRITALIAEKFLANATVDAINGLVGQQLSVMSKNYPNAPINWPDDYDHSPTGAWSYNLHFVYTNGFPYYSSVCDCQTYCDKYVGRAGYCQGNETLLDCCAVGAIEKYSDELYLQFVQGESNLTAGQNNTNNPMIQLLLLAHLIGDVHQPMHVDLQNDLNGNQFPVKWFGNTTCGSMSKCQLHKVWDTMIIEKRKLDFNGNETALADHISEVFRLDLVYPDNSTLQQRESVRANPGAWAFNSVQIAQLAYLPGVDFDIEQFYYDHALPIIELQLFKAGHNIAEVLNYVFNVTYSCRQCRWHEPLCRPVGQVPPPTQCDIPIV